MMYKRRGRSARWPEGFTYCALRARNKNGGFYTYHVSCRMGSVLAVAIGPQVHPSTVTIAGLVVGMSASTLAIAAMAVRPAWVVGMIVLVGWQLAFGLDCADGQIARGTGKATRSGRRVDALSDFAGRGSVIVAVTTVVADRSHVPAALLAVFAISWMVNLVVFLLWEEDGARHSLLPSNNPIITGLKLLRDDGFVLLVLGLGLAFWRRSLYWGLLGLTIMNTTFLAASIANEFRLSLLQARDGNGSPTAGRPAPESDPSLRREI